MVRIEVKCPRENCEGDIVADVDVCVLDIGDWPDQADEVRCTVCKHQFSVGASVAHLEECHTEEDWELMPEDHREN